MSRVDEIRKKNVVKRPTAQEYETRMISIALSWVNFVTCKKCGWPTVEGYCCMTCGTTEPR